MANHWSEDGDLVIEERTLFRQVGWLTHNTKTFHPIGDSSASEIISRTSGEGFSPVYEQIAVDHGEGWQD